MTNTLDTINKWHQKARPSPDSKAFNVQLGCHLEEVAEMLDTLTLTHPRFGASSGQDTTVSALLFDLATALKTGDVTATATDREALDAAPAASNHEAFKLGYAKGVDDAERRAKARGEQPAAVEQEPVAWQYRLRPTWVGGKASWGPWEPCTKGQAEDCWKTPLLHDWAAEARPLYTAPQPTRRPLTSAQIDEIADQHRSQLNGRPYLAWYDYARAIERAHGIGGEA